MLNALTVDVEDWYHATYLGVPESSWPGCERRLSRNTRRLLDILAEAGTRATFFLLGCVADELPDLVRAIAAGGHELACHSYYHRQVSGQTRPEFVADVKRCTEAIRRASGAEVLGYRAPAASIGPGQDWVFGVLADEGFVYDSSIMPARTPLYGTAAAPRFAHRVANGRLFEVPLSTAEFGRCRFPIAGGVYLRLLPFGLTCRAIERMNQVEGQPAVIYLHPWEIDPQPPRLGRNWLTRWSHTINKEVMEQRVRRLLDRFSFGPITEVFDLNGGRASGGGA